MTIVGLVIQQRDGNILFQNVREYLSFDKAHLAAKAFKNQISSYDDSFLNKGSISHLTGSIVVLNMYRVYYLILNELYILAISQANDNPYEGASYLARAKRVLWSVSKDYQSIQITKKYTEVYFALERVLFGEDGVEVLSHKLNDMTPHCSEFGHHANTSSSVGPSFITGSSSNIQSPITIFGRLIEPNNSSNHGSNNNSSSNNINHNDSSNNNSNNFNSLNNLNSISNKIYQTNVPLILSSTVISSSSSSSSNNNNNHNSHNNHHNHSHPISPSSSSGNLMNFNEDNNTVDNNFSYQLESLTKLESSIIPDKIFTQPNILPKIDKHIYDPPQTIKWGNTSVQSSSASSTRVSNRIMFTLRHPNAGKEAREKEKENELKEQQEISNMNNSSGNLNNVVVVGSNIAGSASNKSSPSTSPLSSSGYNPSSPETSSELLNNSNNNDLKNSLDNNNNNNGDAPDTPKRKFSLSMGTFNSSNNKPPLNTSNNSINTGGASAPDTTGSTSVSSAAPPPVPLSNSKTKMNFLNF